MRHQPKKLALLISLIGVGVSPYAYARADLRVLRSAPPAADAALAIEERVAVAFGPSRWSPVLSWQGEQGAFDSPGLSNTLRVAGARDDDWAPGEVAEVPERLGQRPVSATDSDSSTTLSDSDAQVTATVQAASVHPKEAKPKTTDARARSAKPAVARSGESKSSARGPLYRVRVLTQAVSTHRMVAAIVDAARSPAITRSVRLPVPVIASEGLDGTRLKAIEAGTEVDPQRGAAALAPHVMPASAHMDRLMESLAAIVREERPTPAGGLVASTQDEPILAPSHVSAAAEPLVEAGMRSATSAHRVDRPEIVVASQASKVLGSLEAILSNDRDEVGASVAARSATVVATQAGKVLAALAQVSTSRGQPEDGASKRARKLDKAKQRMKAAAAASAATATLSSAAPVARIETALAEPAVGALGAESVLDADFAAAPLDIDLTLARSDQHAAGAAAASEAVDIELPLALEPPAPLAIAPLPGVAPHPRAGPFGGERVAISENALDRVRGGFFTEGLNISFGIERAVYINGTLVTTTSLNVSDLGRITAGRGMTTFDSGTLALIQSGAGNIVSAGAFSSAAIGTVVQNTLDGQKIQNVTVINATVNSLGVLRGLNLQSSLRGAVIDSLRR